MRVQVTDICAKKELSNEETLVKDNNELQNNSTCCDN